MPLPEFEVITRYFSQTFPHRDDVVLGIGDDAALCVAPVGMQLVIAIDTLVAGVHFPQTTAPQDIGYKALAVNLSDIAAMGAMPAWMTLALTCPPTTNDNWLANFSCGLRELAECYQISLIGGDTTAGPLTITIQVIGLAPWQSALYRHGAKPGDGIYVTGTLGDAGLGLASIQQQLSLPVAIRHIVESRLNRPTPRLREGQALRGIANSAIDISDGLIADLGHILAASQVGAAIYLDRLPLSKALHDYLPVEAAWQLALNAGDDYELCFTVPQHQEEVLSEALGTASYTQIGIIEVLPGLRCFDVHGQTFTPNEQGYQHQFNLKPT